MKITYAIASLAVVVMLAGCAPELYSSGGTTTYLGFSLGIESAPPPPRFEWNGAPRYEAVEASDVRIIDAPDPNCDMFAYQGSYYIYSAGFWYRGASYDGPYSVVEVRRVPRAVLTVPDNHWHHRPQWDRDQRGNDGNRGRGHGWGRDKGQGNG